MRIAYLIRDNGTSAELVARGPAVDVKKRFIAEKVGKDETLLMLGKGIIPKRRGGRQDITEYLATVEKENAKMRDAAKEKAVLREKLAAKSEPPKDKAPKAPKN